MKKFFLIFAGFLFTALGVIGIFLPLLPTTPFLLLAAAAFFRSSEKYYRWLLDNKYLGKYIKNYREKRGIPSRAKITALILLWISIGYSAFFAVAIPIAAAGSPVR